MDRKLTNMNTQRRETSMLKNNQIGDLLWETQSHMFEAPINFSNELHTAVSVAFSVPCSVQSKMVKSKLQLGIHFFLKII